jgi:hypothetical protein
MMGCSQRVSLKRKRRCAQFEQRMTSNTAASYGCVCQSSYERHGEWLLNRSEWSESRISHNIIRNIIVLSKLDLVAVLDESGLHGVKQERGVVGKQ